MYFKELIDALAEKANVVGGIELDDENRCFMEFDDMGVVIQGVDETSQVLLLSAIAEPPPERLEELYRSLLAANHLLKETSGATLSIDPEDGWVYLCKILPYAALDGDKFVAELGNYVNAVASWRTRIKDFRASDATSGPKIKEETVDELQSHDPFLRV